jgi:hypothetical protein
MNLSASQRLRVKKSAPIFCIPFDTGTLPECVSFIGVCESGLVYFTDLDPASQAHGGTFSVSVRECDLKTITRALLEQRRRFLSNQHQHQTP